MGCKVYTDPAGAAKGLDQDDDGQLQINRMTRSLTSRWEGMSLPNYLENATRKLGRAIARTRAGQAFDRVDLLYFRSRYLVTASNAYRLDIAPALGSLQDAPSP
jgi:hypothetical protein